MRVMVFQLFTHLVHTIRTLLFGILLELHGSLLIESHANLLSEKNVLA